MASRTSPQAGDPPWLRVALAAVLLLGAVARLTDVAWDDGHEFHPDERAIVFAVERLSFSPLRLDPGFFAYGSFPLYVIRGVTSLLGLIEPSLRNDFGRVVLAGRVLSALAGVFTLLALFRLGARLYGRPAGLLAAAFLAFCPLHVQNSHFLTTDVALTLLVVLVLHACLGLAERGRPRDALLVGALTGLALATKVAAVPLLAPLLVAVWHRGRGALARGAMALLAMVATFLLGQPYAVLSFGEFWRQVAEQGAMVRSAGTLPYTIQYVGVPKYAYDLWQMALWGMGPALGLAALWASGRALWRLRTTRTPGALVLAAWVVPSLAIMGAFDVKYPRYLLPIYPVLLAWTGAWLWETRGTRAGRVLLPVVGVGAVLSGFAFLAIYRGPHTAVAASEWVYANVPEGRGLLTQHWDEGFPLPLPGRDPSRYRVVAFPFYEPDGPSKKDDLARELASVDAVVLPTRRIVGAVSRVPDRFPMTNAFYRLLFAGRLGFVLAHEQSARPRLGPLELPDELADESLSVYDHPKVLVFVNSERLDSGEIARRLEAEGDTAERTRADLLAFGRAPPGPFGLLWARDPVRQGALALLWWAIVVELLALAAYALLAPWLPRVGGFALSRVLGIIALAWPAWWLGYVVEGSFQAATLLFVCGSIVGFGAWAWRRRALRWPREGALVETLFWGAFAVFVLVRAGNPAVFWGEKPMDFAFLNTLTRTASLPPPDPWFAGSILHYTWFGHFVAAALGKLCGLHPGVTFNLAIALVGACCVSGAYAIGAVAGRSRRVGLLAAVLVALVGNLAGPVELWWRRRGPFDAFWAGSRVVPHTINEYPLWSILFADLHAHVLVLPFTLAFLALLVLHTRAPRGARTWPRLALLSLLLGAILVTNAWSGVTLPFLVPFLLVLLLPNDVPRNVSTLAWRVALPTGAVWAGALVGFLPFWRGYRPPSGSWGWERGSFAAFPEYALVFGLFLAVALPLLLRPLVTTVARVVVMAVLAASAVASVVRPQWGAWRLGMLVLCALAGWIACRRREPMNVRVAGALLAGGFLLTAAADVAYLWDRMNTVFKLYLDAWVLLASGAAVALWTTWRAIGGRLGPAWRGGVAALGACALVGGWHGAYAVVAQPRVASPRPTLDGTAYLAIRDPWHAAAVEWLNAETRGTLVVAEAWGDFYSDFARVSMNTGLPTIVGWDYHVHQRARDWPSIDARKADVSRLYLSGDEKEVRAILDRYAVRYVYVGDMEQRTYGPETASRLAGFPELLRPVYRNPGVLILATRRAASALPQLGRDAPGAAPPPEPGALSEPRAVAVDEQGRVFVADFGHHRVQVLDAELAPAASYGGRGAGAGLFEQPCALALGNGRLYVADTWNQRVQVLQPDGGMEAEWRGSFFGPRGIAVDEQGRVYVADTGNHRVRVFDRGGNEIGSWGRRGRGAGELDEPMCVATDASGRVYVCDNGNARVQVFDGDGVSVRSFPVPGWRTAVHSEPKLAVSQARTIWVTVPLENVVRAYDAKGRLLRELSGRDAETPFRTPLGVAYDPRGPSLLVTDLGHRVLRVPLPREVAR